jgi:predicted protein tyrosine phosphatase
MFIKCTQRHYGICALIDLAGVALRDPNIWNVISVIEPEVPTLSRHGFLDIHRMHCYDIQELVAEKGSSSIAPNTPNFEALFGFTDPKFGEPHLFHCTYGSSRSPAEALLVMIRDMTLDGFSLEECIEESIAFLLSIRPRARTNGVIMEQGLSLINREHDLQKVAMRILTTQRFTE